MLYNLQKAIMDKYNSTSGDTLRGLVLGLWEDEAPSSIVLETQKGESLKEQPKPFLTFSTILTDLEQDACSNMFLPLVQFTIHGDANNKSSLGLLQVGDEFLSVFGDELLSMDNGYTMIRSDTVGQSKFKDIDKMWIIIYEIQYMVEKDR